MSDESRTRASLLLQLHDSDNQLVWQRFVEHYGPMIYGWCKFWKLQEADAEDVTQALILKLFQKIQDFHYDPQVGSFRAWLKTVTHNAVRDFLRLKCIATADSGEWEQLQKSPAHEDFAQRIERAYDLELLAEAKSKVRARVAAHTWQAFEQLTEGKQTVAQIAAETGLQIAMVYVAKSKVIRMLKEEIAAMQ